MNEDKRIEQQAIEFARANKKKIAAELTDIKRFPPDATPVSVFMAGSPGAGKTESSLRLIEQLSSDGMAVLRIDADDLRPRFQGYTGKNSSLFQAATSIIADCMQDRAIAQRQSYLFDGTLSNLKRSRENIARCLKRKRVVQILYVYQDPIQAWRFVQARRVVDGRDIPQDVFIDQYFLAQENVNVLKREFVDAIQVDVLIKNIDGTDFGYWVNVGAIDGHVSQVYTRNILKDLLA